MNNIESNIGMLSFQCNICGAMCHAHMSTLNREVSSCKSCGSTVRMRAMVHALSVALFGTSYIIPEFPSRKDILGKGMSDWDGYAIPISQKLGYVNTYYHKEPRLDITNIAPKDEQSVDFILSTDVFEHVAPPVSIAFANAKKMLKPGGAFVFSVPYALEGNTQEHFPDLFDWKIFDKNGQRVLVNQTREGKIQEFTDLVFHGGEGDTLETRVFSESDLVRDLNLAGFEDIQIMKEPYFDYGIYWPYPWSLPIIAREKTSGFACTGWGPQVGQVEKIFHAQVFEKSALWFKASGLSPKVQIEIHVDGNIADGVVISDNIVTGYIPEIVLKKPGNYPVVLKNISNNTELTVGFFKVLP